MPARWVLPLLLLGLSGHHGYIALCMRLIVTCTRVQFVYLLAILLCARARGGGGGGGEVYNKCTPGMYGTVNNYFPQPIIALTRPFVLLWPLACI